jgi:FtsP/CotA-like multicopper oxidase with cupredoxin domain
VLFISSVHIFFAVLGGAQTVSLPEPPQVRAPNHLVSLTLHAVNENGRDAFAFDGEHVAPVIRASPGDVLKITYINDLPAKSPETELRIATSRAAFGHAVRATVAFA